MEIDKTIRVIVVTFTVAFIYLAKISLSHVIMVILVSILFVSKILKYLI